MRSPIDRLAILGKISWAGDGGVVCDKPNRAQLKVELRQAIGSLAFEVAPRLLSRVGTVRQLKEPFCTQHDCKCGLSPGVVGSGEQDVRIEKQPHQRDCRRLKIC